MSADEARGEMVRRPAGAGGGRLSATVTSSLVGGVSVGLLVLLWLWLAYSAGGFLERQWLLPALTTTFFALVVFGFGIHPRRPRSYSLIVLGLLCAYGMWVALSITWAPSTDLAWQETNRTFFYLLVFGLALVCLTDRTARGSLRYLLLGAGVTLALAAVWRLAGDDVSRLFISDNRFYYPVSYPNGAAALYLLLVWPLAWLGADPQERVVVRALSVGTISALLCLAVLTQSRGGLYALAISGALYFALSPARLRTLFYLAVPAVLLVWAFPGLNRYWTEGATALSGGTAAYHAGLALLVGSFVTLVLALLEGWVQVSRRMRLAFGLLAVGGLLVGGAVALDRIAAETGSLRTTFSDMWDTFTGEEQIDLVEGGLQTSRLGMVSASGRIDLWRVGWDTFREHPVLGVGADGYIFQYDRERSRQTAKPRQPHSIELRVLSETGAVGGILFFGALGAAGGFILWPRWSAAWSALRRRRSDEFARAEGAQAALAQGSWGGEPRAYAWDVALLAGFLYWLVHGSVEWLWHMPGVSVGALLLLALALSRVDARRLWFRDHRERLAAAAAEPAAGPGSEQVFVPSHASSLGDRAFRWSALGVGVALFAALALPYLSLQFRDAALSNLSDPEAAVTAAGRAALLNPADPEPHLIEADAYRAAARRVLNDGGAPPATRLGAAADALALAAAATAEAVEAEPVGWAVHYRSAVSLLELLALRNPEANLGADAGRWSAYAAEVLSPATEWPADVPAAGESALSLATPEPERSRAGEIRALSDEQLASLAQTRLEAAAARNPLAGETAAAQEALHLWRSSAD